MWGGPGPCGPSGAYRQQVTAQLRSTSPGAPSGAVELWKLVTDAPAALVDRPGPDAAETPVPTGRGPDAATAPGAGAAKAPAASGQGPTPAEPAGPSEAGPGTAAPTRDRGRADSGDRGRAGRADRDRAAAQAAWTWRGRRFRPRPAPSQAPTTTGALGTQGPATGPAAEGPAAKDAPAPAATATPATKDQPAAGTTERPSDRDKRSRRAWNLRRLTSSRRPETPQPQAPAAPAAAVGAEVERLGQSIESATGALGGQSTESYERDLPRIVTSEIAKRVRADVIVLLLDNGQGVMEVSGEVGLTLDERQLSVEYSRDVMRELFRAGVGLIEDTDRVRGALASIPGSRAEILILVPLVHERLGFGVLIAGRHRSANGEPAEVFTDRDVQALMGFADGVAELLRSAVLLRHLKGQLSALEDG